MIRKLCEIFVIFTVIASCISQEEQQLLEQSLAAKYGETCENNRQCQLTLTENAECSSGVCRCKTGNHLFSDGRCYVSVLLDEFCRSDGNCWMSDGSFANCVSGRCTCKFDRQVPSEDKLGCIDARGLGERCDNDRQCSIVPNAVCRVDCKCNTRYTLSRDQKRCLEAATEFGDMCEENDQCSAFLKGSICKNGTCTCEVGQHGVGTRCIRTLSIAESCTKDEECVAPRHAGLISCDSGYCKCAPGVVNESIGCDSCVFYCNFTLLLVSLVCIFSGL
nr:cell death abnormality protein 1-like [Leptinotarsa decemlineata]